MLRDILLIILLLFAYGLLIKLAWCFFVRPLFEITVWVLSTALFTVALPIMGVVWAVRQYQRLRAWYRKKPWRPCHHFAAVPRHHVANPLRKRHDAMTT